MQGNLGRKGHTCSVFLLMTTEIVHNCRNKKWPVSLRLQCCGVSSGVTETFKKLRVMEGNIKDEGNPAGGSQRGSVAIMRSARCARCCPHHPRRRDDVLGTKVMTNRVL